jgi:alpha-beta hydrolase superfamily lysophospholipase
MKHLVLLALLIACGDDDGVTFTLRVGPDAPAYGDAPFPTDAVRDGDRLGRIAGLERMATRKLDLIVEHVAALDGFGVRPLIEFFADGDLVAEIPATTSTLADPLGLVDVDPASPELGRIVAMDWRYFADRRVLAGSPQSGQVLREGTRYATFATTALTHRNNALNTLASHARWQTTADALAELDAVVEGEIAAIATFTTQRASAPLIAARDHMATLPPPELACTDPSIIFTGTPALDAILGVATRATDGPRAGLERWGNDNPTGIAHDHVGTIATCTFTIARYRRGDTGTDLPDDETFEVIDGVPQLVAIEPIPVTFILPAAPAPAGGYPVIVYGHGLGASRDQLLSFAEPLTSQGYALVGIDMAGHGSRYDSADRVSNMANQLAEFSGRIGGADGFGDSTGPQTQFEFFEAFQNVAAVRDSIRQSALDISRLVQLVRRPDLELSALGTVKLDARRVVYMAESFGTVVGTLLAAIEPDVDLYVLDVPGGGILDLILPSSPEIAQLAVPLIETIYNPHAPLDRWNPLIGLMQAAIDGGDPLTYAPHVLRDRFTIAGAQLGPRHVIAIEVLGDQVLPNVGTEALARELGLAVLEPHLELPDGLASIPAPAAGNLGGQTAVLVQYSPATHGANWSAERGTLRFVPGFPFEGEERFPRLPADITIANPIYETLEQVFEIVTSHRANGVPQVKLTKAPTRDFDGDGVSDDVDAQPLDPTMH